MSCFREAPEVSKSETSQLFEKSTLSTDSLTITNDSTLSDSKDSCPPVDRLCVSSSGSLFLLDSETSAPLDPEVKSYIHLRICISGHLDLARINMSPQCPKVLFFRFFSLSFVRSFFIHPFCLSVCLSVSLCAIISSTHFFSSL